MMVKPLVQPQIASLVAGAALGAPGEADPRHWLVRDGQFLVPGTEPYFNISMDFAPLAARFGNKATLFQEFDDPRVVSTANHRGIMGVGTNTGNRMVIFITSPTVGDYIHRCSASSAVNDAPRINEAGRAGRNKVALFWDRETGLSGMAANGLYSVAAVPGAIPDPANMVRLELQSLNFNGGGVVLNRGAIHNAWLAPQVYSQAEFAALTGV